MEEVKNKVGGKLQDEGRICILWSPAINFFFFCLFVFLFFGVVKISALFFFFLFFSPSLLWLLASLLGESPSFISFWQ